MLGTRAVGSPTEVKLRSTPLDTFGERFKHLISLSKMTQKDVGLNLKVSQTHISGLLKDKTPSPKMIAKIATYFGCSEKWLAYGEEEEVIKSEGLELVFSEIKKVYMELDDDSEKFNFQGEIYTLLKAVRKNHTV